MSESHIPAKPVSSGFRYTPLTNPLTEIRLAILEPALSDDDEIRCQLHTVDITEAKYESLSYAWGDESVKVPIIFCAQPFLVTANLAHALRNLRFESSDPKKKRALWIDALCIDQLNPTERSEQVQRMGSIYKSADNVLVVRINGSLSPFFAAHCISSITIYSRFNI
jgi:Heterokaryon incompatibility protein (HET)